MSETGEMTKSALVSSPRYLDTGMGDREPWRVCDLPDLRQADSEGWGSLSRARERRTPRLSETHTRASRTIWPFRYPARCHSTRRWCSVPSEQTGRLSSLRGPLALTRLLPRDLGGLRPVGPL